MDVMYRLGLRLKDFELMGLGVETTKNLSENDCLFSLKTDLCLTYSRLSQDRNFLARFSSEDKPRFIVCLALYVLYLLESCQDPTLLDWLKLLPKYFPHLPFSWPSNYLNILPSSLRSECEIIQKRLREDFELSTNLCQMKFSFEEFRWAFSVVHTRCVKWPVEIEKSNLLICEDDLDYALVPYADFFNHSSDVTVSLSVVDKEIKFVSHTKQAEKSQAFLNYGRHSNAYFFLQYGFIPCDNNFDFMELSVEQFLFISQYSDSDKKKLTDFVSRNQSSFKETYMKHSGLSNSSLTLLYCVIAEEHLWESLVKNFKEVCSNLTDDYHVAAKAMLSYTCQFLENMLQRELQDFSERSKICSLESKLTRNGSLFLKNWILILQNINDQVTKCKSLLMLALKNSTE